MRKIFGTVLILAGILLGLYLGVWVCLVGGIAGLIQAVFVEPVQPLMAALNFLRFMCSGLVGRLIFLFLTALGISILDS